MPGEKFGENLEKIDNEQQKINESLDKKEDLIALGILETVDAQIKDVDIDLAIDRENNKYYFISNGNEALNISFDLNQLPEIGAIIVKLFNNDIQLFGDITGRSIAKDSLMIDGLEEKYITSTDLTKNEVEELFVFVMKSKKIPMEDWQLEDTVCKGGVNNQCKEALGN